MGEGGCSDNNLVSGRPEFIGGWNEPRKKLSPKILQPLSQWGAKLAGWWGPNSPVGTFVSEKMLPISNFFHGLEKCDVFRHFQHLRSSYFLSLFFNSFIRTGYGKSWKRCVQGVAIFTNKTSIRYLKRALSCHFTFTFTYLFIQDCRKSS